MPSRRSEPGSSSAPLRWRPSASAGAILVAVVCVAAIIAALAPHNGRFYVMWVYNDPQTADEQRQRLMVDLFMAHTSGWHRELFVALLLGAFLASRAPRMLHAVAAAIPLGLQVAAVNLTTSWLTAGGARQRLVWAHEVGGRLYRMTCLPTTPSGWSLPRGWPPLRGLSSLGSGWGRCSRWSCGPRPPRTPG